MCSEVILDSLGLMFLFFAALVLISAFSGHIIIWWESLIYGYKVRKQLKKGHKDVEEHDED